LFENKKILVCGMARSGQSAALVLRRLGAEVTATDLKAEISWDYNPEEEGILQKTGQTPDEIVADYELIIISPGISMYAPFVKKAKTLGIPVWGEAELAYRLCPCPMIAITGTNGKTTVTTVVGEILKRQDIALRRGEGTVIAGNIGIPLTSLVTELSPGNIVVAEISSFQLETISAFRPKISAVLNMTEDHLDRHKTMENYIAAKSRIFENQRQDDICVLNYDNSVTRGMKPRGRVIYFSTKSELKEFPDSACLQNGNIFVKYEQESYRIINISETKVMPENALAAAAITLAAGVSPEIIAQVLREFQGVPHRLEYVATINNAEFYNDSKATNTDAAIKALEAFSNRQIILISGGYDKKTDFTPLAKVISKKVTRLILIGQTAGQIINACEAAGFTAYERADTLESAVSHAKFLAKPGQIVLFSPACASFDMFKDFEHRGELFMKYVKVLAHGDTATQAPAL